MKYVIKNIKKFATNETGIFIMTVVCIMCSVIIINFSFGFYQQVQQEKLDALNGMYEFSIDFDDEERTNVTKGRLIKPLLNLDKSVLEDCTISFEIRFIQDVTDNPAADNSLLVEYAPFCIQDGKITVAPLNIPWKENDIILDGNYFSPEQFENGEQVCLVSNYAYGNIEYYDPEEKKWAEYYNQEHDGKYTVNGKEYTCIGHYDWYCTVPMVPITTLDDNCYVQRVGFSYPHAMTRPQYDSISNAVKNEFGDLAVLPDITISEVDIQQFYHLLLIFAVVISLLSAIVVALLYEYIIMSRKRKLMIFRLCGLSKIAATGIYFAECAVIMLITYLGAVTLYHFSILPFLGKSFVYMKTYYNPETYLTLGGIYIVICLLFMLALIASRIKNGISDEIREV